MNRKQFRQLIGTLFVLFVGAAIVDLVFPSLVPLAVKDAVEVYYDSRFAALPYKTSLHVVLFLLFALFGPLVGLAGLFFFRRWGRSVYTVIICTMPLTSLFVGIDVSSWGASLLNGWYLVGVGFVLAVAWFSPLNDEFH